MENQPISLWSRFTTCLSSKYCCFSGRATRAEYWGYGLFCTLVIGIPVYILAIALSGGDLESPIFNILIFALDCALLLPGLGVNVRRLHDTGRSGWMLLLGLIPLVGAIILLVFACLDSERGTNKYGPSEKYPEN